MSHDDDLRALADLAGVVPRFYDFDGLERVTGPETCTAMLAANGLQVGSAAEVRETLAAERALRDERWFPYETIVEAGQPNNLPFGLGADWVLLLQDKPVAEGRAADWIALPPLSPEIYRLRASVAGRVETVTILAAPRHMALVGDLAGSPRQWGISAALYGLHSARSTGVGDFADLGAACAVAGAKGAAFFGINPVHAMGFCDLTAISPYSPSHRGFLNTTYIAPDAIPGLSGSPQVQALLATNAAQLNKLRVGDTLHYTAHKALHNALMTKLFALFNAEADASWHAALADFIAEEGLALSRFANFETISQEYGPDWHSWPVAQHPDAQQDAERVRFHCWLQWVADLQLGAAQARAKAASMSLGLYLDVSVGPRRDGAESWCEQASVAQGVSVGAPPDQLSPEGQNWNLTAYAPRKLATALYAPLRAVLARTMRHAGVIRIDHVLGLNRSFWIPDNGSPGAYIRQNFDTLLAVIKIEAHRAGCVVIGEDLGLVPDGFRDTMRGHGFYGYSVLQYEKTDSGSFKNPAEGPSQVLSCFGTHDTPTVRGYETGRDIDWWRQLGWITAERAALSHQSRIGEVAALRAFDPDPALGFADAVHATLAASPADMVCVQLDDILCQTEAQNLPGTIDKHPNWRRRYPLPIEQLGASDGMTSLAAVMHTHGRDSAPKEKNCDQ